MIFLTSCVNSHWTELNPFLNSAKNGDVCGTCKGAFNHCTVMAVNDTITRFTISLGSSTQSENEREREVASRQVRERFYLLFLLRNDKGQRKYSLSLNVSVPLKYN